MRAAWRCRAGRRSHRGPWRTDRAAETHFCVTQLRANRPVARSCRPALHPSRAALPDIHLLPSRWPDSQHGSSGTRRVALLRVGAPPRRPAGTAPQPALPGLRVHSGGRHAATPGRGAAGQRSGGGAAPRRCRRRRQRRRRQQPAAGQLAHAAGHAGPRRRADQRHHCAGHRHGIGAGAGRGLPPHQPRGVPGAGRWRGAGAPAAALQSDSGRCTRTLPPAPDRSPQRRPATVELTRARRRLPAATRAGRAGRVQRDGGAQGVPRLGAAALRAVRDRLPGAVAGGREAAGRGS